MKRIFFLITLVVFFVGLISPFFVFAADPPKTTIGFCPQIDIPGIKMFNTKAYPCDKKDDKGNYTDAFKINSSSVADLAAGTYKFIAGIAGIAAVIVMMAGGYIWLFAGGNASKVGEAKSLIGSAVLGLVLTLGSYMILNLINPKLIELPSLKIDEPSVAVIKGAVKICNSTERGDALKKIEEKLKKDEKASFQCGSVYYPKYQAYEKCMIDHPKDHQTKCVKEKDVAFSDGCMDVYCPEKTASLTNYACIIKLDKDDNFAGGGCESSIYLSNPKTNAKEQFSIDDVTGQACGEVKTWGSDEVSNECGSSDKNKYSCTALISADGMPYFDGTSSGHVFFTYKGSQLKMSCRSEMISQMDKAPLYGWECGSCNISTPYSGSFCGGDLESNDPKVIKCFKESNKSPVCCSK